MKIITLEEHFTSPAYREATAKVASRMPAANREMEEVQSKLAEVGPQRIADMDAAGIDMQVLSLSGILMDALDAPTGTTVARDSNDWIAQAVRDHPSRFAAFAALGLKEPEKAAAELKRCAGTLGFVGAMISGMTDGVFLDDPRFTPILEEAQALRVPIYIHPAPPPQTVQEAYYGNLPDGVGQALSIAGWGWHVETGLHALRLIVSGVFDRFPNLQIIIGHMGENVPFSIARAESVLSRVTKLERPISEYFRTNFYITNSGYFTIPPFLCTLMVTGADRILFAVDYPFSPNETGRKFLDSLPISTTDREKIAHGNVERLFNLAHSA